MEDGKSSSPVEELKKQGNELLKQGDVLGAVAKYSEALQHEPTSHVLLSNRSAAQLRLGRAAAALEDALRAVELAPQWAKAHSRVAAAYRALDRLDEAEKAAQDGLSVEASNETLLQIVERIKVGGYVQVFDFVDDAHVKISVLGTNVDARYELNLSAEPYPYLDMSVPSAPDSPVIRHIYRMQGPDELHLCSPYMRPADERPAEFHGPGFVIMKRGKLTETPEQQAEREKLASMSDSERMLQFLKEAIKAVPVTDTLAKSTDSEAEQASKLAASVRFQTVYFGLLEKFGPEVDQRVKELVVRVRSSAEETPDIAQAVDQFREKLQSAGLMEPAAAGDGAEEDGEQVRLAGGAGASPAGKHAPLDSILESPDRPAMPAKSASKPASPAAAAAAAPSPTSNVPYIILGLALVAVTAGAAALMVARSKKD